MLGVILYIFIISFVYKYEWILTEMSRQNRFLRFLLFSHFMYYFSIIICGPLAWLYTAIVLMKKR